VVAESVDDVARVIAELEDEMQEAAGRLEFERAAVLRDQINALKSGDFKRGSTAQKPAKCGGRKSGAGGRAARR
jgi:excinuclease ABC subunit B